MRIVMDPKEIVDRFNRWSPEPLLCSQGGIPYNKAHLDAKDAEIKLLRERLSGIEQALKERGMFAFEHIDGTFTINDR